MLRTTLTCLTALCAWTLAPEASAETITSVDLYGLRTVSEDDVRAAIAVSVGDPIPDSTSLEARVAALPGVAAAKASVVQYPGNVALFVGVREDGVPATSYRAAPTGEVVLEPELIARYDEMLGHLMDAIRSGEAGEDRDDGYALSHYRPMRKIQLSFVDVGRDQADRLVDVLRNSHDAPSRAAAAAILAYGPDKPRIATELQHAANDPDGVVRNNAVRALAILADYGQRRKSVDLTIDPTPFLELIASLEWTDRNKGAAALASMTLGRDTELLAQLAETSLPELVEMAAWNSSGHASFSMRILGRVAGLPEAELDELLPKMTTGAERLIWAESLAETVRAGH